MRKIFARNIFLKITLDNDDLIRELDGRGRKVNFKIYKNEMKWMNIEIRRFFAFFFEQFSETG